MRQPLTDRQRELLEVLATCGGIVREAARRAGVSRGAMRKTVEAAAAKGWSWTSLQEQPAQCGSFNIPKPPPQDVDIHEILRRRRETDAVQERIDREEALIPIEFDTNEPIGILMFGDPHLDDPRCNFAALERDMALVKQTDGLFCMNIGDTTNNWVGRLRALYEHQDVTRRQAFHLAEWFIQELAPWCILTLGGNHDLWSGVTDPLEWFIRQTPGRYCPHEANVELRFPNGRKIKAAFHHKFKGSSIWNPTHATLRASIMHYPDFRILCQGHEHTSGQQSVPGPNGIKRHLIKLAGYKRRDDYAKSGSLETAFFSESDVVVIDPRAERECELVQHFNSTQYGAAFLQTLRAMRKSA